jgi:hypothetical protein
LQFHQRYNPNLIDDHCQEMRDQLKLRHLKARRITSVVAQNRRMSMGVVPSMPVPEELAQPRRKIISGSFTHNISLFYHQIDRRKSEYQHYVITMFFKNPEKVLCF